MLLKYGTNFIALLGMGCVLTTMLCSEQALAQMQDDAQTIITIDMNSDQISLSPGELRKINSLRINQNDLNQIVAASKEFQKKRNELMGVEVGIDASDRIIIKSRNDLSGNEVAIDNGNLIRIIEKSKLEIEANNGLTIEQNVLEELEGNFGERGAHQSAFTSRIPPGLIQQTVDPVSPEVPEESIPKLQGLNCSNGSAPCKNGSTTIKGALIAQVVESDETDDTPYQLCSEAREEFRQSVERNPDIVTAWPEWRQVGGAVDASREFENECLTTLDSGGAQISPNVAVIKMPHDPEPFCSGFRIASDQVITAMHCFINPRNGKKDKSRIEDAEIFIASNPTVSLQLPKDLENAIQERRYDTALAREVPAYQDFVLIKIEDSLVSPFSLPNLTIGELVVGDAVNLPGYFVFHSRPFKTPEEWPEFVNVTKPIGNNYCRVFDVAEKSDGRGCVAHSCQAVPGYSGSPILQSTSAGEISLIGLHLRASENFEHHCEVNFTVASEIGMDPSKPIAKMSNLGIRLTTEQLSAKGWKAEDIP